MLILWSSKSLRTRCLDCIFVLARMRSALLVRGCPEYCVVWAEVAEDDSRGGCFGEPPSAGVTFGGKILM